MGGEQTENGRRTGGAFGSSPRGRGTETGDAEKVIHHRVIPAWAGNSGHGQGSRAALSGHPRVGGEQWPGRYVNVGFYGSSPRGRGTGASMALQKSKWRVIPAWAGNRRRAAPFCG